jgi:hypothetical protein
MTMQKFSSHWLLFSNIFHILRKEILINDEKTFIKKEVF